MRVLLDLAAFATPLRENSMRAEKKYREEIVRYGRMLHERGFVAAMDGNLSVRLDEDRILVTPTCVSKGAMRAADMVIVDRDGTRVAVPPLSNQPSCALRRGRRIGALD